MNLINQDRRLTETLLIEGSCDCSYDLPGKARFRVNIFSQLSNYSIVLRKLESKIPTVQDMNLPAPFMKMAEEKNGIIFITGATGSGKTTSLAAVLNEINEEKSVHIVTLEDPVEYQHPHKRSTFNQREMGNDFDTFASGLRAALRQAPKVILVGEMRDRETVEIGAQCRRDRPPCFEHPAYRGLGSDHQPHPRHVSHRRGEPDPDQARGYGALDCLPAPAAQGRRGAGGGF